MARKPKPTPKPETKKVTKKQMLVDLISRPHGASINELMEATGWQKHTCRGVIANEKKKRELNIMLVDGRYSIVTD